MAQNEGMARDYDKNQRNLEAVRQESKKKSETLEKLEKKLTTYEARIRELEHKGE